MFLVINLNEHFYFWYFENMKKILAAILISVGAAFLFNQTVSAQKLKKMKWETDLCEIEGTYDSSKYTETQLRNTLKLFQSIGASPLFTHYTVFKYEDIKTLSVAKLDTEYKQKIEELKNLDIVKTAYWETIRQKKLRETEQSYKLGRLTIQSYTNPTVLMQTENVGECREKFAEPLVARGDSLLDAWKVVNEINKSRNCCPENLQQKFDEQYNSPDKFKYAVVEVTAFGWWNCVNAKRYHVNSEESQQKNFDKLFKKIKEISCDEP